MNSPCFGEHSSKCQSETNTHYPGSSLKKRNLYKCNTVLHRVFYAFDPIFSRFLTLECDLCARRGGVHCMVVEICWPSQ